MNSLLSRCDSCCDGARSLDVSTSYTYVRFSIVAVTILLIAHKMELFFHRTTRNMVLSSFFWFHVQLLSLFIVLFAPRRIFRSSPQRNVSISQNNRKYQQLTERNLDCVLEVVE